MFTRRSAFIGPLLLGAVLGCSSSDDASTNTAGGSVAFTISGEALALGGYAFPAASKDDIVFVDGWEVKFEEVLVTVDQITLSEGPDTSPTDQSKVGALVAQVDGPFAVDLHKGGPLEGKGGSDEQALPIAKLSGPNKASGAFAADKRYAFGFSVVPAVATAKQLNLDAQGKSDYAEMITKGYTALFVGTATFKGTDCTPKTDPVLDAIPKTVKFRLGFKTPTKYVNCQNPDNDPAKPFGDEEHQRGIAIKPNAESVAQLTIHTDHLFWESIEHDSPAHFDQYAAFAKVGADGVATVTTEDLVGVDPKAIKTKDGKPLPWRSCVPAADYPLPTTNPMGFDTLSTPVNPSATPDKALRDLYDYEQYNESTAGHLNADGLCYVVRGFPSPP